MKSRWGEILTDRMCCCRSFLLVLTIRSPMTLTRKLNCTVHVHRGTMWITSESWESYIAPGRRSKCPMYWTLCSGLPHYRHQCKREESRTRAERKFLTAVGIREWVSDFCIARYAFIDFRAWNTVTRSLTSKILVPRFDRWEKLFFAAYAYL